MKMMSKPSILTLSRRVECGVRFLVSFWRLCIEEKEDRGETKRKGERAGRATRRRKEKEISIHIPYLSALSVGHDGQCQDGQDRKHAGTAGGRRGAGAQELARAQASAPEVRKLNFGGSGRRGRHCIEQRYGLLVDAVRQTGFKCKQ